MPAEVKMLANFNMAISLFVDNCLLTFFKSCSTVDIAIPDWEVKTVLLSSLMELAIAVTTWWFSSWLKTSAPKTFPCWFNWFSNLCMSAVVERPKMAPNVFPAQERGAPPSARE